MPSWFRHFHLLPVSRNALTALVLASLSACGPTNAPSPKGGTAPLAQARDDAQDAARVSEEHSKANPTESTQGDKKPDAFSWFSASPTEPREGIAPPTPEPEPEPPAEPPPPPPPKPQVQILAPAGHLPDWLLDEFQTQLDCEITVDTYDWPSQGIRKLDEAPDRYDVVLATDRMLVPLIRDKKLAELPQATLQNDPDAVFTNHTFDRDNMYAWPYAFSLAGYAYHDGAELGEMKKWSQLFQPERTQEAWMIGDRTLARSLMKLAGIAPSDSLLPRAWPTSERGKKDVPAMTSETITTEVMTDDASSATVEETTTASISTEAPDIPDVPEVQTTATEPGAADTATASDSDLTPTIPEEITATTAVAVAPMTGKPIRIASIAELMTELSQQPGWAFVLPKGPSLVYLYHVAQPADADDPDRAAQIIERLREPETAAKITGESYLGATQAAARRQQPAALQENKLIYPSEETLDKTNFVGQ